MAASIRRSRRTSRSIGAWSRLSPSSAIWLTAEPGRFPKQRWRAQPPGRSTWRVTPGGSIAASPTARRRHARTTGGEADRWRVADSVFVAGRSGGQAGLACPNARPHRRRSTCCVDLDWLTEEVLPTGWPTQDPLPPQPACSRGRPMRWLERLRTLEEKSNILEVGTAKTARKPFLQFLQCRAPGM